MIRLDSKLSPTKVIVQMLVETITKNYLRTSISRESALGPLNIESNVLKVIL